MHILTLSHILAKVIYTPEFWNQNFLKFFTTVTTSLFEGFKQQEIFFRNLVILKIKTSVSKFMHLSVGH